MNKRAGARRRLAASLYETVLLSALALVTGFALLPALGLASPSNSRVLPLLGPAAQAISFVSLFAVLGAYCVWGWSDGRQTLPMKTWHIAVESTSGSCVSMARAALRYVAWWIGPALTIGAYATLRPYGYGRWAVGLLAVNYAWALLNTDRQFLHDRLAGTRLTVES